MSYSHTPSITAISSCLPQSAGGISRSATRKAKPYPIQTTPSSVTLSCTMAACRTSATALNQNASSSVPISAAPTQPTESFEQMIGTRWVVWVGGVALALGGVFLVTYAVEQGFVGPGVRVTLAAHNIVLLVRG